MRRLTGYEWFSIVVFIAICVGSIWYLITSSDMIGDVDLGFHGNLARFLGIGVAVILALALNIAFIKLARAQSAMEEAEANQDKAPQNQEDAPASSDRRDGE